jgi:hypothetical protein
VVTSLEGSNLVVFYYLSASDICPIRGVSFGEMGLIRGVAFGEMGLRRTTVKGSNAWW